MYLISLLTYREDLHYTLKYTMLYTMKYMFVYFTIRKISLRKFSINTESHINWVQKP